MRNLFKTEFFKLSRSKALWVIVFLFLFCIYAFMVGKKVEAANLISFCTNIILSFSLILPLYGIVLVNDFMAGYYKEAVFVGNTKWQVYFTRYAAFLIGILGIVFLPLIAVIAFYLSKDGATEIFANCDSSLLADLGFLVLYCTCFSAFVMMVVMIGKSYATVVFLCIFYNMMYVFVHEIIPQNDIPNWVAYSFLGVTDKLLQVKGATEALKIVGALLGQTAVCTGIGYAFFKKRELR